MSAIATRALNIVAGKQELITICTFDHHSTSEMFAK